ncbi:MAG TPA: glyoxylate/hydroxypyruvate reductase A [Xanthobacteraceae bacterium]|nr:glyoxylate/hydroxypyruvate reductase A [Xanthobacteraceae bacterium]
MSGILVALAGMDQAPWVERLQALEPGRPVRAWPERGDPSEIGYLCVWKPPSAALTGWPNLKGVLCMGAGVDHLMQNPALPAVPVVRVVDPDLTARMSEYIVLHVLLHHRALLRTLADQKARHWAAWEQSAASAVRVGLLGLGELGLDAARKLAMMGFQVAGWSRSPKTLEGIETFSGADGLDAFLARTDIAVVVLPLTDDTRNMIDRRFLARLARDGVRGAPVLINVGRGGLQVEADILAALDDGTLGAASLDVFQTEPLPADSRFWSHPNVVLTPHTAAESDPVALSRYAVEQIRRFEAGQGFTNTVDPARGY